MEQLEAMLVALVGSTLMPLVVLVACAVDGFFPPMPSETLVVAALAAVLALPAPDPTMIATVLVVAAFGAAAGDSIAYAIGRTIDPTRRAWGRGPRLRAAFDRAERLLRRRPATLVLVGRYVPVGRVAVNMMAGATRMPYSRFAPLSAVAAVCWAAMCLCLSVLAGTVFGGSPLLAAVTGIAASLVLGVGVDLVTRRRTDVGTSDRTEATT